MPPSPPSASHPFPPDALGRGHVLVKSSGTTKLTPVSHPVSKARRPFLSRASEVPPTPVTSASEAGNDAVGSAPTVPACV
jgi:hypothetical protein